AVNASDNSISVFDRDWSWSGVWFATYNFGSGGWRSLTSSGAVASPYYSPLAARRDRPAIANREGGWASNSGPFPPPRRGVTATEARGWGCPKRSHSDFGRGAGDWDRFSLSFGLLSNTAASWAW